MVRVGPVGDPWRTVYSRVPLALISLAWLMMNSMSRAVLSWKSGKSVRLGWVLWRYFLDEKGDLRGEVRWISLLRNRSSTGRRSFLVIRRIQGLWGGVILTVARFRR